MSEDAAREARPVGAYLADLHQRLTAAFESADGASRFAETAWARQFVQALQPHRADRVYVNFLDADDDDSRIREAYGDHTFRRLAEIKSRYDPDNVFHHNKNIRPG